MNKNHGGPAFPLAFQELDGSGMPRTEMYADNGMSLRDWFAGQALIGLISSRNEATALHFKPEHDSEFCFLIADAMLKAREQS